jgi:putative membrane protein
MSLAIALPMSAPLLGAPAPGEPAAGVLAWGMLPLAGILLVGALYGRGYVVIARRSHRPGPRQESHVARRSHRPGPRHAASFGLGLLTLVVALVSPLAAMSHRLFAAHMVQHLLLMSVAPPLLVWGRPSQALWAAASPPLRRRLHRAGRLPLLRWAPRGGRSALLVTSLFVAVLWVWHAPALYQAALRNEALHAAEHLSMLGTSLLLWRLVLGAPARRRHGQAILSIFASGLAAAALGAVLTFSTTVLYPAYATGLRLGASPLTPLEDQQLAGTIMWIPPGLLSLVTMIGLAYAWLAEADRRSGRQDEARRPAAQRSPESLAGRGDRGPGGGRR